MPLSFEPVNLSRQSEYLEFLRSCPTQPSDYSFVNLWCWSQFYGLEWAFSGGLVWIRQTQPEEHYWAPVGAWESADLQESIARYVSRGLSMIRVPETLMQILVDRMGNRIRVDESRGHWDYLYSLPELMALKGNRFHKKKNLLNQFKKKYAYQYLSFDEKRVEMALGMQENWCTWRDCEAEESLDAENRAIARVLHNWKAFENLEGGAVMVDGEMAAYTIGERLSRDILLIHFEKGSPGYKGIYQAINQLFLAHVQGAFQLVNREQDLDNEGMRKAKMSYHPVDFIKKYALRYS